MGLTQAFAAAQQAMVAHQGNYFWEPIPIQLDDVIDRFVREFMTADDGGRAEILAQLTPRDRQLLQSFGIRSATLGVRSRNVEQVMEGLIALRLGWPTDDERDQIRDLAAVYHAALATGAEPATVFRQAAGIARDDEFTAFLEEFLSRPEGDKSLKALGYREVNRPDGFRLEPGGDW